MHIKCICNCVSIRYKGTIFPIIVPKGMKAYVSTGYGLSSNLHDIESEHIYFIYPDMGEYISYGNIVDAYDIRVINLSTDNIYSYHEEYISYINYSIHIWILLNSGIPKRYIGVTNIHMKCLFSCYMELYSYDKLYSVDTEILGLIYPYIYNHIDYSIICSTHLPMMNTPYLVSVVYTVDHTYMIKYRETPGKNTFLVSGAIEDRSYTLVDAISICMAHTYHYRFPKEYSDITIITDI